jgi:vancomycin resistance protein YoaR
MSRAYRPPIQSQGAARPVRRGWRGARTGLVLVAGVLALGALSVAGAHFWPSSPPTPPAPPPAAASVDSSGPAAASALEASSTLPTPVGLAATATAERDTSHLAALLDAGSGAGLALDVSFGEARQTLHQPDLASLVAVGGGQLNLDTAAVQALTARLAHDWDQPMRNARFNWNGGDLTPIRDSQEGRTLDQVGAAAAIGQALLTGQRVVSLPGTIVQPRVSSANPQALGITTNLDRGGTSFAGSIPEKAHNIRLAAESLNGVVIPPGGTFSFNQEVGPTTLDAAYQWGFGIEASASGARTVPSVAGGICQVATTLFQRVFWSGFPLVERHWHLYWIPAYTSRGLIGLDATVDEDSGLDFRWSNPTDGYVLIQSATDDSNVYFGLYGDQRNWKVSVDEPQVSRRVPADPAPVAETEPTLPWGRVLRVETARDGFDVAISRTVTREDGQPRTLTLESSYEPSRTVTLVGTKDIPADADVNAVLARVAPPRQAPAVPSAAPSPVETNAPVPGSATLANENPPPPTPTLSARSVGAETPTSPATLAAVPTSTAAVTRAPDTPTPAVTSARPAATAGPPTATPRPAATAAPNASPATR